MTVEIYAKYFFISYIHSVYLSNTEWVTEKWVPGLCKNFGNLLDEGHEGKLDVDGSLDFIYSRIRSDVH